MAVEVVKENVRSGAAVGGRALALAAAGTLAALLVAALVDRALPEPLRRGAPEDRFIAEIAHEHLVNLTSIGPRVAGSYENEVAAVGVLVAAVGRVARAASPHNHVELDLHRASGAFSLTFFDGMNNVYRDVQSVVARVRGAGGGGGPPSRRTALLLNCHFDTVPDSPGASDDGAGCAVLLETMRALAAARRPLRHDAIFLFNGAEENIMQASHAFITTHKWAKSVRAFINIEACGAGGREVLFQAGPHDPWIMEVYAREVPHPFASSLAQELFESGLIPADTDFRIFRDFGNLSGVDLAWSSNGYVYHTRLDTADRVPPAALQRTGDNVLALARGLLSSERLESEVEAGSRQPVFFDVLGSFVVCARAPLAAAAAAAAFALLALKVHLNAADARRQLYMRQSEWWRIVRGAMVRVGAAQAGGVLAACGVGALLHAAGARLAFYSRPLLLAPLYAAPALAASAALLATGPGRREVPAALRRGWWEARAVHDACALWWGALAAACALLRLRSGFVPWLWVLLPTAADLGRRLLPSRTERWTAWWWGLGSAAPVVLTWYLALSSLAMFVPIMGRAGAPPLPPDVMMAGAVAVLVLATCGWMLPLLAAARGVKILAAALACSCVCACAYACAGGARAAYSPDRPQRLMVFEVTRQLHPSPTAGADPAPQPAPAPATTFYWIPELDANTPYALAQVPELRSARVTDAEECARWVYCGAPYFLPVLGLVPRAYAAPAPAPAPSPASDPAPAPSPAPAPAAAHTHVQYERRWLRPALLQLTLNITGPSHVVVIVSPAAGGRLAWSSVLPRPLEARPWGPGGGWGGWGGGAGDRRTYFLALHTARAPATRPWHLDLHISLPEEWKSPALWRQEAVQVSVAGHAMSGARSAAHAGLLRALGRPRLRAAHTAPAGWPVHLHLYSLAPPPAP